MTLIANVIMTLKADANVQHQKTDLIFTDAVGRIFTPARYRRQGHIPRHWIVLFNVAEQRIGNINLIANPRNHGLHVGQQIGMQLRITL